MRGRSNNHKIVTTSQMFTFEWRFRCRCRRCCLSALIRKSRVGRAKHVEIIAFVIKYASFVEPASSLPSGSGSFSKDKGNPRENVHVKWKSNFAQSRLFWAIWCAHVGVKTEILEISPVALLRTEERRASVRAARAALLSLLIPPIK